MISDKLFKEGIKKIVNMIEGLWVTQAENVAELRKINTYISNIKHMKREELEILKKQVDEIEDYRLDEKDLRGAMETLGDSIEAQGGKVKKLCERCGESIPYALKICEECTKIEKIEL